MSARPSTKCRGCSRPRVGPARALRAERPALQASADRARRDRGPGGRHPRPRTTISIAARAMATSSASSRPTTRRMEVFAHIGGLPLGLAFDRDGQSLCLRRRHGPLSRSRPTARSRRRPTRPIAACTSVIDDSRLRAADDLDIADDGRIFFTEATCATTMPRMAGRRSGGARQRPHRLLRPGNRHDAHRAARAEVPQRRLRRARRPVDPVRRDLGLPRPALLVRRAQDRPGRDGDATNLPGYPDNINRASDGNYWMAWSACARPRSTSPGACRASASA